MDSVEIPSNSNPGETHIVNRTPTGWRCSCIGFAFRKNCRHCRIAATMSKDAQNNDPVAILRSQADRLTRLADRIAKQPMDATNAEKVKAKVDAMEHGLRSAVGTLAVIKNPKKKEE
jgi:hypothetical protein